jgi:hypothetical protein
MNLAKPHMTITPVTKIITCGFNEIVARILFKYRYPISYLSAYTVRPKFDIPENKFKYETVSFPTVLALRETITVKTPNVIIISIFLLYLFEESPNKKPVIKM